MAIKRTLLITPSPLPHIYNIIEQQLRVYAVELERMRTTHSTLT